MMILSPSFEYERWRHQPCDLVRVVSSDIVDVVLTGELDPGLILRIRKTALGSERKVVRA